jgi:hypothetical protein
MSNYFNVDFGKDYNVFDDSKFNSKNKFIERKDPSLDIPGYWVQPSVKSAVIDAESTLINPSINSKDKVQIQLNDTFSPDDYNINYHDNLKKNSNEKNIIYYMNKDGGAGRGFGNLNISNDIRYGNFTRKDTKEFKEKQEAEILLDYQYQYLSKNFQDPNHLVMPIPRGGESTRKNNQLSVNTMRQFNTQQNNNLTKTIKFEY